MFTKSRWFTLLGLMVLTSSGCCSYCDRTYGSRHGSSMPVCSPAPQCCTPAPQCCAVPAYSAPPPQGPANANWQRCP